MKEMKKVIWAVDAFAHDKRTQLATYKCLAKFLGKSKVEIEPVSVLSPDQLQVPVEVFKGNSKEYRLEADTLIRKWIKSLKDPRILNPTFLLRDIYSKHVMLDVLLNYARESGAALIALGTHNKNALERLFVGSFAETMILKSDIPMLIVNPKSTTPTKISRILFPTDLTAASFEAFQKLIPVAKELKAKVTIFYKFEYPVASALEGLQENDRYTEFLQKDIAYKQVAAQKYQDLATKNGIKSEVLLDTKPGFVLEGILKTARKLKVDLIAMASSSGAAASTIIGSVARQMVRTASLPLWVIHPDLKRVPKQKAETPNLRIVQA